MTQPDTTERRTDDADSALAGGGDHARGEPRREEPRRDDPRHDDVGGDRGEPGRYSRQHGEAEQPASRGGGEAEVRVLDPSLAEQLRAQWNEVQAGFVDEPRQSVTQADGLVGQVLDEVSRVFRDQRAELEQDWNRDGEPDTEEMRQALRRYREFFDRLLSL